MKTKEEIIKSITETTHWGLKKVTEEAVEELLEAATHEGTEWSETITPLLMCYKQIHYASDKLMKAMYDEIVEAYVYMYENTEIVEYPGREYTVKEPAKQVREWTDC